MKYLLIALMAVVVLTGCKSTPLSTPGDGPNDRHTQSASDNLRPPNAFGPR